MEMEAILHSLYEEGRRRVGVSFFTKWSAAPLFLERPGRGCSLLTCMALGLLSSYLISSCSLEACSCSGAQPADQ